jgi:hypothetical protein
MKSFKSLSAALSLMCVIVIMLFSKLYAPSDDKVLAWVVWSAFSVSIVLPLLALGISLSFVSLRFVLLNLGSFFFGYYLAFINYDKIWFLFTSAPNAKQHLYLTLPIASLCAGTLLLFSKSLTKYLLIPFSFVVGAMVSITTKLTDPTLHDPIIVKLGFIIAIWIILSSMYFVRVFYAKWFEIAFRIFGSWLIASALLYGGTTIAMGYGYLVAKESQSTDTQKIDSSFDDVLIPDFTSPSEDKGKTQ